MPHEHPSSASPDQPKPQSGSPILGGIAKAGLLVLALLIGLALVLPGQLSTIEALFRRTPDLGNQPWHVGETFPSNPCACPRLTDAIYEAAADGETICVTGPVTRIILNNSWYDSVYDRMILTGSTLMTSYEVYGHAEYLGEGDMIAVNGQVGARPQTLNYLEAVGSGMGLFRCR